MGSLNQFLVSASCHGVFDGYPINPAVGTPFEYERDSKYRKISNTRRNKSQNLNNYRLVLQLSLLNPLKWGVKSRMEM